MYEIVNNLRECNIKIAMSVESNGTTLLRTADFEARLSV